MRPWCTDLVQDQPRPRPAVVALDSRVRLNRRRPKRRSGPQAGPTGRPTEHLADTVTEVRGAAVAQSQPLFSLRVGDRRRASVIARGSRTRPGPEARRIRLPRHRVPVVGAGRSIPIPMLPEVAGRAGPRGAPRRRSRSCGLATTSRSAVIGIGDVSPPRACDTPTGHELTQPPSPPHAFSRRQCTVAPARKGTTTVPPNGSSSGTATSSRTRRTRSALGSRP